MNLHKIILCSVCLSLAVMAQQDGRTPEQRIAWERGGRLQRGDVTVVDEYQRENNLPMLWSIFGNAYANEYGLGRTTKERQELKTSDENRAAINQAIRDHARKTLESIPGHAKHLADQINLLADETDDEQIMLADNRRVALFRELGNLGSPECIQQIGRFMLDDRCPKPTFWSPDLIGYAPHPVSDGAVYAMDKALGDASPLRRLKDLPSIGRFQIQEKYMQDWWRSEESAKYRVRLPGVEPPPDPPPLEGPLVRPAYTPVPSPGPPAGAPVAAESRVMWKEMLVLGSTLLAVLLLVTWLASRRRARTS